jgi:hypothetical protein
VGRREPKKPAQMSMIQRVKELPDAVSFRNLLIRELGKKEGVAMSQIKKSVGKGGKNEEADVKIVQGLLNKFTKQCGYSKLGADGKIGAKTLSAIGTFQQKVVKIARPDQLVSPGGPTIKKLNESPSSVAKQVKENEQKKKPGA